jgi:hypothetical protein
MAAGTLDWKNELGRWLRPFLERLGHGIKQGAIDNGRLLAL